MHVTALADMLGEKTSVLDDLEDYYYHAVSGIGKKSDLQQNLDDAVLTTRIAEEEVKQRALREQTAAGLKTVLLDGKRDAARQQAELSKLAAEDAKGPARDRTD
ncbi:hypothetical protein HKX48_001300 [Thoreauomyces humboldtii]|nr:hypothetical protein HKX48_001300 [Thoreauomyces humboldtii]